MFVVHKMKNVRKLILLLVFIPQIIWSQSKKEWQHFDPDEDKLLGISTFKAFDLLKDRKPETVIVAVIDNGVELDHHDLQGQFWINPGEIPGNGIDDDKNGYIDDMHGWNFLGNPDGRNIKRETLELTRIYKKLFEKFGNNKLVLGKIDSNEYRQYLKINNFFQNAVDKKKREINLYKELTRKFLYADSIMQSFFGEEPYSEFELYRIKDTTAIILAARNFLLDVYTVGLDLKKLQGLVKNNMDDLDTRLNPLFDPRNEIIGDNPFDLNDKVYGNNKVDAEGPYHGTLVAGTIAALWNDTGVNGIARDVKLMIIRVLPNGDERDKDVALAIRYAVKNKADIINCSFGKSWSPNPEFVQQAIKEAEDAGVLIVHAAGNDGRNSDSIPTYPTGFYADGKKAPNWISVGATGPDDTPGLPAYFSNYGKKTVDVFAPGLDIPSCVLGSKYDLSSGTSTAAPVVSGMAAVLKSYFPHLKAIELRQIIMESVYLPKTIHVRLPGNKNRIAPFKEMSVSGGIVNLYRAVQLALDKYCR